MGAFNFVEGFAVQITCGEIASLSCRDEIDCVELFEVPRSTSFHSE